MADLTRPNFGEAWASEGERLSPGEAKLKLGWVQEMMTYQYENYLQARQDEAILYLLQKGVPEYSATQEYTANKSVVVYQGNLYMATATVTGVLPTVTASWKRISPTVGANGAVSISSGGTGATTIAEARTNLGLGTASTANLPTTNGVVVRSADNTLISRLLTGTTGNISVTNPDGVAGNINIDVGSNVAKLNTDSSWTSKGGITLPKGSSSERGVEVPGKIRYNTELQKFEGYNGTDWNVLGATSEIEVTTLSGNGVDTDFVLNTEVFSVNATDVFITGVYQNKDTYTISGANITFSEAPTAGVDNIQVLSRRVVDLGIARANQVEVEDTSNLYSSTTVEGALREVGGKVKFIKNAILSYPDYAAASAAAATLPDGQVVDVAETLTRYDVASGALRNAHPVTPLTQIAGVVRSVQDKLGKELVSVLDFGAFGDGQYHPLSERFSTLAMAQVAYPCATSLSQSIDWAAFQTVSDLGYSDVYAPAGVYFLNELFDSHLTVHGDGVDEWDLKASWRPRKMSKGTTLLIGGIPTKYVEVVNVSNMRSAGGVVPNDAYEDEPSFPGYAEYSLLDYTNGDAVGANPATPKKLKVGIRLHGNAKLKNLRVQLNYFGVDGYNSAVMLPDFPEYTEDYYGLGDDWDIGVLTYNAMNTGVIDCQVVGYWRMAARAVIASNYEDGKSFGGAVFNDQNIFYQGYNGLSIRSGDVHRVTAVTASTVSVPWNASHTVPTSGKLNNQYTYTSSSKSGDMIVLSGFSKDMSSVLSVGSEVYFGTHPGFAGSTVSGGFICGLGHFTNRRAFDTALNQPFPHPSKAYEISGNPLRDIDFIGVHFFDTDVIGFLHDALHISHVGCYAEAQGYSGGIPGGAKGARYIVSCRPELTDANGPYPAGNTRGFVWDNSSEMSDASVDMYPVHRPAGGRFTGARKYFMPDSMVLDAEGYWPQTWDTKRRYDIGARTFVQGSDGNQYFEVVDAALKRLMRINSWNERIGFGTASPGASIHRIGAEATEILETIGSGDPAYGLRNEAGTWFIRAQQSSINQLQFRYGNNTRMQVNPENGTIFAGGDNVADIGTASSRYANIRAANGAIVTSDEREKTDWRDQSEAEKAAALEIKQAIKAFKFSDAVNSKGESARWHWGVGAQTVGDILRKHGIDPATQAYWCYDEWEEQPEMKDEEGNITQEYRAAGNRYGIRYDELAMFILAAI